jgi:hypothetical protein
MNNPDHIFVNLETIIGFKHLNSLMRIRDGKNSDPGSGMVKVRIWDPGWKKLVGSGMEKIRNRDSGWKKLRIRDLGWKNFVSGMKKLRIRIRDKHTGSAALSLMFLTSSRLILSGCWRRGTCGGPWIWS